MHWKITPAPPPEEETFGFEEGFFCQLWDKKWDDRRDLEGKILDKDDLPELKLIVKVLNIANGDNSDLRYSIQAMINKIEKHGSITIGGAS